jgi:hypothetical protein
MGPHGRERADQPGGLSVCIMWIIPEWEGKNRSFIVTFHTLVTV